MWPIRSVIVVMIASTCLTNDINSNEEDYFEELEIVKQNVSEEGRELSKGINKFTLELYKVLKENEGNLFYSPLSIATNLGMLYFMTSGESSDELTEALQLSTDAEKVRTGFEDVLQAVKQNETLALANKAFIDERLPIKDSYLQVISKYLESEAMNLNYNNPEDSRVLINKWTEENTGGKIPELLPSGTITSDTRMVLVSTVHFKGIWHYKFLEKMTTKMDFHLADGTTSKVDMMTITNEFGYKELKDVGAKVLHLPYKRGLQIFTIVLPDKSDGLPQLEEKLIEMNLQEDILDNYPMMKVKVTIPKFRLANSVELSEKLQKLNILTIFSPDKANFSKAVDGSGLFVSVVQHSACIDLDEAGTEAAAATASVISMRSGFMLFKEFEFRADHPFVFFLTDSKTKSVLFAGRYSKP